MRRTLTLLAVLSVLAPFALAAETACSQVPEPFCDGSTIHSKNGGGPPALGCTECVERGCCDLIGDCQAEDGCTDKVRGAQQCVENAGRSAGSQEPTCTQSLDTDRSRSVYGCMREQCGTECGLPVCQLDSLVPGLGTPACDHCFAQSCCQEMNACAHNRSCLLALQCIVEECADELPSRLTLEAHPKALELAETACREADAGTSVAGIDPGPGCFGRCIARLIAIPTPQAGTAVCLAARVNECGAAVACGAQCIPAAPGAARDASADAPGSD